MAREGFAAIVCAVVLFIHGPLSVGLVPAAAAEEGQETPLANALAVQTALQQGRGFLEQGNFAEAVRVLESQLTRINGNREYLLRLRDAYRGHVKGLVLADRQAEAQVYRRRLEILDPPSRSDLDKGSGVSGTGPAAGNSPASDKSSPPLLSGASSQGSSTSPSMAELAAGSGTVGNRTPIRARGKMKEGLETPSDDPFHPSNRKTAAAPELLARAAQEWGKRQFQAAGGYYEQAHQVDPSSTADCREQWAYCKLFTVVQHLNQSSPSVSRLGQLEQEARAALSLAPRLEPQARDVLARIEERKRNASQGTNPGEERSAGGTLRQGGTTKDGWGMAESTHFRIFHNQNRELVEKVADVAEKTRRRINRYWFGDDGETWPARCDLYLHASAQDYGRATGKPTTWPAHSTISSDGGRVVSRRIDLHCDDPDLFPSSLPHETTHVVLAGRFGGADLPRWADEGMALLTEPPGKLEVHLRGLTRHGQEKTLFGIRDLWALTNYPEAPRVGAFYSQSLSLTQYLVNQGGPMNFTRFLNEALRYGYDKALQRTYGLDLTSLEQRWRQTTLGNNTAQAALGR